jgi:hypothetical protein
VPYVIDTVRHTYSKKDGFRSAISAKLYDGTSGGKKKSSTGEDGDADATADKDKVAKDAPAGTPATPTQWASPRNGLTDSN